ncbi:MAG: hypothetical protein OHK0022_17320 [Roseiflexaceae bacterium]
MAQTTEALTTAPAAEATPQRRTFDAAAYWRTNLRLIVTLLVIWFSVSFLPVLIVKALNQFNILTGFPLGYYMGSQGSLITFVVLIFYYAYRMERLDREFGLDQ